MRRAKSGIAGRIGVRAAVGGLVIWAGAATAWAGPVITFDLRLSDGGKSRPVAIGEVIDLELYALVDNQDGDHTNDRLVYTWGSFLSGKGGLLGDIRGDTPPKRTHVNNVDPFIEPSAVAASGFQLDLDGDGDLDVGQLLTTGGSDGVWFVASGGPTGVPGSGMGSGATEFLIGTTAFTVMGWVGDTQTELNYVPRYRTDGLVPQRFVHRFVSDGVMCALNGDGRGTIGMSSGQGTVAVGQPVLLFLPVPEPVTGVLVMIGLAGAGLACAARRRRSG